ncbi:MAG: hydratase [Alcaligenaceae bacterium]|nr:MAG: hydratase [Alcaligenaceae bacterium]
MLCWYVFKSREEAFANADEIPGGESTAVWAEAARRLNIYVVAGTAERAAERLFNSAVLVGPEGYIGTYRKLHLWGDEHLFFEAGDLGLPVFHTEIGRLAVLICYDGWFPEVYRLLAMRGADVVCMPTNWVPMAGQSPIHMPMANTLAMASAHSNSLNIVCANRVGTERGQPFIGCSLIVGSDGWPLAGPASPDGEEILYANFNLKATRGSRHLTSFNDVILLDEIAEGVQPSVVERIAEALLADRKQNVRTLIMVEQNVPFVLKVVDRYIVLKQGEVVDEGNAKGPDAADRIIDHLRV